MTTASKEKLIEKITYKKNGQALCYREIYEFKGYKIKIEICADDCSEQSYAIISVLKDLTWNTIYTIPHAEMNTKKDIAYKVDYRNNVSLAEKEFKQDVLRLKNMINELI